MGGDDNRGMTSLPFPDAALDGVAPLPEWGVIRAHGPDAAAFLHAQLTQDVTGLPPGVVRLAGYCSPKGRLLASFLAWRPQPDTVLLACSADVLPAVLKRLSMFVLRSKVVLSDATADMALHGLAGATASAAAGSLSVWHSEARGDAQVLRLPDVQGVARALWAGPALPAGPALDASAWRWLEVASGVPRITAATAEQFVPQMVNLELLEGVNFRKGCYPGQEVVARSQYRGTLKRRTFLFEAEADAAAGQEVFHAADPSQPAGMVVLGASCGGRHLALVEVKLAALDGGALQLAAPGGPPLSRRALPYEVPLESAAEA